jgi:hypothetical protein
MHHTRPLRVRGNATLAAAAPHQRQPDRSSSNAQGTVDPPVLAAVNMCQIQVEGAGQRRCHSYHAPPRCPETWVLLYLCRERMCARPPLDRQAPRRLACKFNVQVARHAAAVQITWALRTPAIHLLACRYITNSIQARLKAPLNMCIWYEHVDPWQSMRMQQLRMQTWCWTRTAFYNLFYHKFHRSEKHTTDAAARGPEGAGPPIVLISSPGPARMPETRSDAAAAARCLADRSRRH